MHFAKRSNFESIDFIHFFAKRRNSVEKMIHQKKNRGHRTSKIVKSRQSYSNGHLPYHCLFYYLARARCMTWHVNLRARYAMKRLAQTFLNLLFGYVLVAVVVVVCLSSLMC